MTIHAPASIAHPATNATDGRLGRIGGAAALLAAGTFGYGIALFATSLGDYVDPDATPAESVDFLVDHQGQLLAWYIGIFIVFGAALVPLRSHCGSDSSTGRRSSPTLQPCSPRSGPRSCTRPA